MTQEKHMKTAWTATAIEMQPGWLAVKVGFGEWFLDRTVRFKPTNKGWFCLGGTWWI